jgi:hypothetical protein
MLRQSTVHMNPLVHVQVSEERGGMVVVVGDGDVVVVVAVVEVV